jgi:hypothetical protein
LIQKTIQRSDLWTWHPVFLINQSTLNFVQTVTDTPKHIYDLQIKIRIFKTPVERLMQFLKDNDDMRIALKEAKIKIRIAGYGY